MSKNQITVDVYDNSNTSTLLFAVFSFLSFFFFPVFAPNARGVGSIPSSAQGRVSVALVPPPQLSQVVIAVLCRLAQRTQRSEAE